MLFLSQPPGVDITPDDPRWIGAWWLGYFFGGLLLLCTSIALLGYPKEMPGAQERRMAAIKEGLLPARDEHIQGRLRDILPATKAILTNKTFMLNTWAFCCTTLIATGLGPFVSKFIQSQFGKSSSTAGLCVVRNDICLSLELCLLALKFILSRNRKVLGSTLCKGHFDFTSLL